MQDALHHVGFTVGSMERSIEFYSVLLQAEPAMRRKYSEQFISEVVGYEETLLKHGVKFRSQPVDVPADIEEDPAKGGRALYLRDPDGITVELLEMLF